MFALIGRRILIAIPTLILVSLIVFALQKIAAGRSVC
jgi:ABC-type dipeptide/oligopeptide/nickel transport system permease component